MQIRISVRNLIEFVMRSGDIDNRRGGMADKDAMLLGSRIHRRIQKSMGPSYKAEVPLSLRVDHEGFEVLIEGRADGLIIDDAGVCIDEIKGVFQKLDNMEEAVPVHLGQARIYAYIYAVQNDLDSIGVQMTYANLDTEDIKRFNYQYTKDELEKWFGDIMNRYYPWAAFKYNWSRKRNESAGRIEFPFEYRKGQKQAVSAVYRTIEHKKKLFLMAPTGVGKTMACIFPSVKAVGEGRADTIFYLTAKTITRTVAQKAFSILADRGLSMKVLTLTAKEKICFSDECECNPDACPYAKGHYDRVNDAVFDLLTSEDACDREIVEKYALKHRVCPFEMALDLSLWVDAVICDYNYLFDPNAHLRRFFADGVKGEYIFLIDEAHNLVDRGRSMFSASLSKGNVLELKRKLKDIKPSIVRKLDKCNRILLEWKKECQNSMVMDNIGGLSFTLMDIMSELNEYLEKLEYSELRKDILDFYFELRDFLSIYELCDDRYVIYAEQGKDDFRVNLYCVDPSLNLSNCLDKGVATVFFSATLLPVDYYRKLLSTGEEDYTVYAESSFPAENRLVALADNVSSKYSLRGKDTYEKYAVCILEAVRAHKGNYMAFFPSYAFMNEVQSEIEGLLASQKINDVRLLIQTPGMKEKDKEGFLGEFETGNADSLLGLCVMGGIFSEGIDLTDDSLIGAFIIGTGLPQVCNEREILREYFDKRNLNGFDYAYLYSGMNRVLQAAGRVIRTHTDRGIVMLLDSRFRSSQYRKLFPREWSNVEIINCENAASLITDFWK